MCNAKSLIIKCALKDLKGSESSEGLKSSESSGSLGLNKCGSEDNECCLRNSESPDSPRAASDRPGEPQGRDVRSRRLRIPGAPWEPRKALGAPGQPSEIADVY